MSLLALGCSNATDELEVLSTGTGADEGHGEAQLAGTLSGTAAEGLACFTVTAEDGHRYLVSWPEGYSALDGPLRLLDENGTTVAADGDSVVLVGGTGSDDESDIECGDISAPEWRAGGVVSSE
ncbi:hypothetical protein [Nocardiopsis deserti]|uniref:hypothetical protein n=1 Tax=Nocardiopsis deserti TaxID=2605988 RepID=UPI0012389858|nr:hypothetical protein [Nocardiopsis deserti]